MKYRKLINSLSDETRAKLADSALSISSAWQPPMADGRKLKGVSDPSDPWVVQLFAGGDVLTATFAAWGAGPTFEAALVEALGKPTPGGLVEAMGKLAEAADQLTAVVASAIEDWQ